MAQRLGTAVVERASNVDFVLGTERLFELPRLLESAESTPYVDTRLAKGLDWAELPPVSDNPYAAFVTITRGCNNFCAFCIVPYLRGRERHRDPKAIVNDINGLIEKGIREVTLVGQNVNSYRYQTMRFPDLIRMVLKETDLQRLRFITPHPKDLCDDLISLFADEPRLMGHMHFPLQSGSDRVLKKMFRRYNYAHYKARAERLREAKPDIALTTDLIVGFPTETEEEFQMTLDAVREIKYDSAFMFRYSVRDGTWASKNLEDDIPEQVKLDRLNRLIELQKENSRDVNQKEVGVVRQVLIDGVSRRESTVLKGKTEGNKTILVSGDTGLIGRVVPIRVTQADSWTLHGELAA
jgi:tRNA-2-methylthio-N6-dimethylallyladenosine synthase